VHKPIIIIIIITTITDNPGRVAKRTMAPFGAIFLARQMANGQLLTTSGGGREVWNTGDG
jgi:hypothetical protein